MLKGVRREDAAVYHLPGRDWLLCVGPENTDAEGLTLGVAVFPEGSAPPGHVHDAAEEVIYIVSGHGQLVTPEGTESSSSLARRSTSPSGSSTRRSRTVPGPLELISAFSPPVVPGSYEKAAG